ncbi:MAG: hypothetical protein AAF146_14115 [Bacteroidota bacterium]
MFPRLLLLSFLLGLVTGCKQDELYAPLRYERISKITFGTPDRWEDNFYLMSYAAGGQLERVDYSFGDLRKYTLIHYEQDRPVRILVYDEEDQLIERRSLTYDADGLLASAVHVSFNTAGEERNQSTLIFSYDAQGRRITEERYAGYLRQVTRYEWEGANVVSTRVYNSAGKETSWITYQYGDKVNPYRGFPTYLTCTPCQSRNNEISRDFNFAEYICEGDCRNTYLYDLDDRPILLQNHLDQVIRFSYQD